MSKILLDVIVVLVIVCIGGFFSGSEMALVSLREGQVRALAKRGRRGQRTARLASDPTRFFSAVQIGVTLATLVSGAYGAATLAGFLKSWLIRQHVSAGWAATLSFVVVTVCITFVSLVLGELAPKRLALQRAPRLALLAAPLLDRIASLARPVVWLLTVTTNVVIAVLGGDPRVGRQAMTEQELRDLVTGAQALSQDERHIVGEVFDAGKRQIREVLVPRTEVVFLDAETPVSAAAAIAAGVPHSRLPVFQDSYDNVIGFVHVRDLLGPGVTNRSVPVGRIARPVKFLPISKTVLSSLSEMRRERAHLAIVVDDYGGTAGIVTLEDLVEELIGDIRDEYDTEHGQATTLRAGEVEVDGLLNLDEFAEQTGIYPARGPLRDGRRATSWPRSATCRRPGASVQVDGHTITVTELDGRRIARLRVAARAAPPASARPASAAARPRPGPAPAPPRPGPGLRPGLRLGPAGLRPAPADAHSSQLGFCWSGPARLGDPQEGGPRWKAVSVPGGFDTVLVVDFGAQYAQLIARRVRECHVYSEIVPSTMPAEEMLARQPKAIILSGGPSSVYADGAPPAPPGLLRRGVPVLGICYGFQLMVAGLGGTVERTGAGRVRRAPAPKPLLVLGGDLPRPPARASPLGPPDPGGTFPPDPLGPPDPGGNLFPQAPSASPAAGCSPAHPPSSGCGCRTGTPARRPPPGFTVTARTAATPVAAVENPERAGLFGVQFHPEVMHTEHGTRVLARFLELAGCRPSWTMLNIVEEQVAADPRAGRRRPGDLRAVRRGGLRGRRGARAARHRRPSDLRVRRSRAAAQGRGRTGRAGLRGRHRRPAQGGERGRGVPCPRWPGWPNPSRSGRSSAGSSSARSSAPPGRSPPRPASTARRASSWSRARCTRTWWSRAAAPAPRTSSRTTTSAGCPTI